MVTNPEAHVQARACDRREDGNKLLQVGKYDLQNIDLTIDSFLFEPTLRRTVFYLIGMHFALREGEE